MSSPAARPLAGVLVVDLGRYLPGPLVSRILGDLGARVIKVEEPELGDPVRHLPPAPGGQGSLATLLLAGHESLALDLKREAGREALEELLGAADVLLESFRPGTLARFGLDPRELRRRHPRLVICSLTGWGQDGPHAHRAGHDLGYQALAGALAASSHMPAVQVADVVGAWSAATAVTAALLGRERDGAGCWIDQALLDAAGHASLTAVAADAGRPRPVGEPHFLTGDLPGYGLYRTRDGGLLALATLEPRFWQRFCRAVGRADLALRQASTAPEVAREVAEIVAGRTRSEWDELFAQHDLPGEPVLSVSEAREHPQVRHRGLYADGDDGLPRLAYPALFDGERPRATERFPALGEDTERLVDELGIAPELSPRARRRAGIGPRRSLKRWLLGVGGRVLTRLRDGGET